MTSPSVPAFPKRKKNLPCPFENIRAPFSHISPISTDVPNDSFISATHSTASKLVSFKIKDKVQSDFNTHFMCVCIYSTPNLFWNELWNMSCKFIICVMKKNPNILQDAGKTLFIGMLFNCNYLTCILETYGKVKLWLKSCTCYLENNLDIMELTWM